MSASRSWDRRGAAARLVKDVSTRWTTALLLGTASSYSITGITEQANTIPATLDVTDADSLLDAIGLLNAQEVTPNRWLVNGNDFVALRKLKEATDSSKYLLESTSPATPPTGCSGTRHGDEQAPRGHRGAGRLQSDRGRARRRAQRHGADRAYAEFDMIGLRVVTRYDLGLLHAEAVSVLTVRAADAVAVEQVALFLGRADNTVLNGRSGRRSGS